MLYINHDSLNPYFNLAVEEYLLNEFDEDVFMLWRNKPSIIVGKNQNTMSQINIDYVRDHSIPVVRRLSGGGAVFHDLGNLNFTFIQGMGSFNDFQKFTRPVLEVLHSLSIDAQFSGRNDLTIGGKKFSGNAQCSYNHRLMHHGTLLFSSQVQDLSSALKVNPSKFQGKGINSTASRVTNISEHLRCPLTIVEFRDMIMKRVMKEYGPGRIYQFADNDISGINRLMNEKYMTWDWNYGRSPEYRFKNEIKCKGGTAEFNFNVSDGIITEIKITGDFFGKNDVSDVEKALVGKRHRIEDIESVLSFFNIDNYFSGASLRDIAGAFFDI